MSYNCVYSLQNINRPVFLNTPPFLAEILTGSDSSLGECVPTEGRAATLS